MGLFDLSLRQKLPLWGSLLIVITAVVVTTSNLVFTRENIKKNMLVRSEVLGRSLVKTLYSAVSQDDVWRAYEIIHFPLLSQERQPSFQLESLIVLDAANKVFISTKPAAYPLLSKLHELGREFSQLEKLLAENKGRKVSLESERIFLAIPIVAEDVVIGTLILVHPENYYRASFDRVVKRTAWTTLGVLLLLLPINWYWGRRMASPLSFMAERMAELAKKLPTPIPDRIYPHGDELGRLFRVYGQMQRELADKAALERQIVKTNRLAALGRLTTSIAHEINNPLGGLLTAVDTLKRHGQLDPVQAKVLPLLERGLSQIQDIVAALLVEAKAKGRALTRQDVDDIHTLLAQEAKKRAVAWEWRNDVRDSVELPATLVRQVLINLLLNAAQAAEEHGHVRAHVWSDASALHILIGNSGPGIAPELMEHLFEPFNSNKEEGQGLGLWITCQIVQQLHGHINVESNEGWTTFTVDLPIGAVQ